MENTNNNLNTPEFKAYSENGLRLTNLAVEYHGLIRWFEWYDRQVMQAQRAQRTGMAWSASDGEKSYNSLSELDADANVKQVRITVLRPQVCSKNKQP